MLREGRLSVNEIGKIVFLSIDGMASSFGTNPRPIPCSTIGRIWSVVVTSIEGFKMMSAFRKRSDRY